MKNIEDTLKRLERSLTSAMDRNPHSSCIISAFRPLIIARTRLVDSLELPGNEEFTLDKARFKDGVPLARQSGYFREDDPFESVAISLMPALKAGFPDQVTTWERLTGLIDSREIRLYDFFQAYPSGGEEIIEEWAKLIDADVRIVGFLARSVAKTILERRALDWAGLIKDLEWEKGYCPICGSFSHIAKHKDGTGERWLYCPMCSHEWRFRRVVCPCCENDDQKTMSYFHVEEKEKESAFGCEMCKGYLITMTKVSDLSEFNPEIAALSLAHLDVIMQEKGYVPMSQAEWSAFA
ncbi:MAG TPA: formate dehydrogenase accessory protein FdhE [Deltaproteobacteria bacterium]|jgi:FdhE protein|nr:formate dehydrogenase accessory protein FdhE [Deltaproteobacteria bacterium]